MGRSPRCYIPSFVEIGPLVPEKKIFEGFLPYIENPKIVVSIGSTSFDHVIDVIADDARMLYFLVAGLITLLKKLYRDSGRFVFQGVTLVRERAVY